MIPGVKAVRLALVALVAFATLGAAPAPYFMSLGRDKVYLREGPSYQHRVLWIYRRKGLPVEVLTEYDIWRRVKDSDGTTGWVSRVMLAGQRTIVVTSQKAAPVRDRNNPRAHVIAFAQHGVVAKLEACEPTACRISAGGTEGWIKKQDIWGVGVGEVFK
jgi:SH3-like domain-containing protein